MPVWLNTFYDLNSISKEMQWNMSLVSPNRDSEWIAVCQMLWITANYIITTLLCNIRWILSLFWSRVHVLSTQWIGLMCTVAIQELESPPWCAYCIQCMINTFCIWMILSLFHRQVKSIQIPSLSKSKLWKYVCMNAVSSAD